MKREVETIPPASSDRPSTAVTVTVDQDEKVVRIDGDAVRLTRTEFRLLAHLIALGGGWVTAPELIRDVLGTHHRPDTPLVRVHIHAVRRKLESRAVWLESDPHRLRGYRWMGPGSAS